MINYSRKSQIKDCVLTLSVVDSIILSMYIRNECSFDKINYIYIKIRNNLLYTVETQ